MRKQLSTETLYAGLYVLPHGALRSERLAALRQARKARRPRARGKDRRGQSPHMTSLIERPAEVATRTVPGLGRRPHQRKPAMASAVGTLVERTTRLIISWHGWRGRMRRVPARAYQDTPAYARPDMLRNALMYDRGNGLAEHEPWVRRLAIQICFAEPDSPWPRGTHENTTGLRRQDLPKGTDLSGYMPRALNAIAHRLNTRPRTSLNFATPLEVYTRLRHPSPVALET